MKKFRFFTLLAVCMLFVVGFISAQQICSSQTGNNNGYYYSFWTNGGGSVCMTMGSGGQFSVTWSNCGNFVCGKGWNPGAVRTVNYSGTSNGAQSMGLYGWTKNELIEYYVADMGGGGEGENKGSVTSDGGTYVIWKHQQVNQPSIVGTATFWQYKSCRNGTRVGGTITFGNHVNAWRNAGMNLGSTWDYQILAVEGWGGSSGNASMTVSEGSSSNTPTPTPTPTPTSVRTSTPVVNGNITVRAKGLIGGENLEQRVNGNAVASWNMTTSYQDFVANGNGPIQLHFTNDDNVSNGLDIQVDYIIYNGVTYQAEEQETNTAVYQNNACGGSFSELMNCNGYIAFSTSVNTPTPVTTPTPTPGTGSVNFDQLSYNVAPNAQFTTKISAATSASVASYAIQVKYNPAVVAYVSAADNGFGMEPVFNDINNTITLVGFRTSYSSGNGLAAITWKASGTSGASGTLTIKVDTLSDANYNTLGNTGGTASVTVGSGSIKGDVNADGVITIVDALIIAQYSVGLNPPMQGDGDVNCDGSITIVDALMVAQYSVGSITAFSC